METLTGKGVVHRPISATLQELSDIKDLENIWISLQSRSDYSYFQSWGWIGTWLDLLPRELRPKVVLARHSDGSVVGAGIIFEKVAGKLGTCRAYLNQTGDPELDCIWIEYNGFLVDSRHRRAAVIACLDALYQHRPRLKEVRLSGVYSDYEQLIAESNFYQIVSERSSTWTVNVDNLRRSGKDYLSSLSRNCRHQIRRSIKLYEKRGPLKIELARSAEEAKEFLDQIAVLNRQRRATLTTKSAFENKFFVSFHQALLERRFKYGEVLLSRVSAGDYTIGYLYRIVDKGRVYDYQGGFRYEDDARYKPGFVCSVLATRHSLETGILVDDFMAGGERHKSRLCDQNNDLLWITLYRNRVNYLANSTASAVRRTWDRDGL